MFSRWKEVSGTVADRRKKSDNVGWAYRCVGVEVSTKVFDLQLQLLLGSLGGPLREFFSSFRQSHMQKSVSYLEGQVLKEVSGAAGLVCLSSRTSVNPDTHCRGLGPGRIVGGNLLQQLGQNNVFEMNTEGQLSFGIRIDHLEPGRLTVRPFLRVVV